MLRGCVPLAIAGVTLASVPGVARADEASAQDIAQARQLGQQAQAAYDAQNFAEAEKLFAAAQKLYPVAPTLTLGLARSQTKLGKFVAAQEGYNRIVREWSQVPNPSPAFKDALEAAKAELPPVSAKLASVVITVEGPPSPVVAIDGQNVPVAALGLRRPVDPGTHVVKASADGWTSAETTFKVESAANAEAKLTLQKNPDAPVAASGTIPDGGNAASAGADGHRGKTNRTLALVAFGVGGAGLVMGAVTGILAIGKHGDLSDSCPNGTCSADRRDDVDSYKTMGTLSTVGFIVAGVGAAAGAVLWFTAPKEKTAAFVSPYVGLGGAGMSGRF